jgi:hypothetical protein
MAAAGWHGTCWGELTSDSGVDLYRVPPLKNGWRLAVAAFHDDLPREEGDARFVSPFPAGA